MRSNYSIRYGFQRTSRVALCGAISYELSCGTDKGYSGEHVGIFQSSRAPGYLCLPCRDPQQILIGGTSVVEVDVEFAVYEVEEGSPDGLSRPTIQTTTPNQATEGGGSGNGSRFRGILLRRNIARRGKYTIIRFLRWQNLYGPCDRSSARRVSYSLSSVLCLVDKGYSYIARHIRRSITTKSKQCCP